MIFRVINLNSIYALVMAQLEEWSIPTSEVHGSNSVMGWTYNGICTIRLLCPTLGRGVLNEPIDEINK